MIPYDKDHLAAEIPQMEESIRLFEGKIAEMRETITQYRIWIAELEKEDGKTPAA